jgi:hypothetical protein
MAKFPIAYVGAPVTADFWNKGQTDTVWKGSNTPRVNNTLLDDPDLSGVELVVGTHLVTVFLNVSVNPSNQTADFKMAYSFTGTASGTRIISGPDEQIGGPSQYFNSGTNTHTNNNSARTLVKLGSNNTGNGLTNSINYGLNDIYPAAIQEMVLIDVSVTGNLALQWAQNVTTPAASVSVYAGSWMSARQVA